MKETIERLQRLADRAKKYNWNDESQVVVKLSDVRAVLEFYERHKSKSEPPSATDITPEWDKIPERFKWVCIDRDGEEIAHQYEPGVTGLGFWMQKIPFLHGEERKTGRFFDMTNIDWAKTLSKRPAK